MPTWEQLDGFRRLKINKEWWVDELTDPSKLRGTWLQGNGICVSCKGCIESKVYFDKTAGPSWRCHDCACKEGIVW